MHKSNRLEISRRYIGSLRLGYWLIRSQDSPREMQEAAEITRDSEWRIQARLVDYLYPYKLGHL